MFAKFQVVSRTAPADANVPHARTRDRGGDFGIEIRTRELRLALREDTRDVERDVSVADYGRGVDLRQIKLTMVGMMIVPTDEAAGCKYARQCFARNIETPVERLATWLARDDDE